MTHMLSHDELLERRSNLLAKFSVPEDQVYELARNYALRPNERAIFRSIEACDFLLEAGESSLARSQSVSA